MALGTARLLGLPIDDKGLQVIALPFPPLPTVGPKRRTNHIDLMLGLGGDEEVRIDIAAVEQVCAGRRSRWARSWWMVGPMTLSCVVAGVVITWVIRSGWPASQVSVRCTL